MKAKLACLVKENWKTLCVICVVFAVMLVLNINAEYISDDFHFKFVFQSINPGDNERPIKNIVDFFESAKGYYLLSGGRVFTHLFVFAFDLLDKSVFNVINSLAFVALGLLIARLSGVKGMKKNYAPYIYI